MNRIGSIFLLLLLPALIPAQADTGSRLKKDSVTDMATYHFERGQKVEAKAEKFLAQYESASGKKAESLREKAEKQYFKASKLYERSLRINPYHSGASKALGHALLRSGTPAEVVERLTEATSDYPEIKALQEHLAEARSALKAASAAGEV